MARFVLYLDEDSQAAALEQTLGRAGMIVFRSDRCGMDGASDDQQLAFATRNSYVIYTGNVKDFDVLHRRALASNQGHSGMIIRTRQLSIGEQARRIIRIWQALSAEQMLNRAEALTAWAEST